MNRLYVYNTGAYAKERLLGILASDRMSCNPDFIEDVKEAIKTLTGKYEILCDGDVDIQIKERILIAKVPLHKIKLTQDDKDHLYKQNKRGYDNYEAEKEESPKLKSV
ncbi:MAG: cell division topological specificity factor MinE [Coprococcus sp.]|nr:cell division topological specificity factor MinE [Coprococcus sp.]